MKNNNKGNGNLVKGKSTKKEGSNAERNKEVSKEQLGKVSGGSNTLPGPHLPWAE